MTIQKQYLEIPLGIAGQNTKLDSKVVAAPQLLDAINVEIDAIGALKKRTGYAFKEASPTVANPIGIGPRAVREGNPVSLGRKGISEYYKGTTWKTKLTEYIPDSESWILDANKGWDYTNPSMAYYGGYILVLAFRDILAPTWGISDTTVLRIYDPTSKLLVKELEVGSATYPADTGYARIVVVDGNVLVFYTITGALGDPLFGLASQIYDSVNLTLGTPSSKATTLKVPVFDMCVTGVYADVVVFFDSATDYTAIKRYNKYNSEADQETRSAVGGYIPDRALAICPHATADFILVAELDSGTSDLCYYCVYNKTTLAQVYTGSFAARDGKNVSIATWDADEWIIYTNGLDITYTSVEVLSANKIKTDGTLTATSFGGSGIYQITKPMTPPSGVGTWQAITNNMALTGVNYLVEHAVSTDTWDRPCAIAKFQYGMNSSTGSVGIAGKLLSDIVLIGSDYYFVTTCKINIEDDYTASDVRSGIVLNKISVSPSEGLRPVTIEDKLYIPGSIPTVYDGERLNEIGFTHPPAILGSSLTAGNVPNGTYSYIAVYEMVDRVGNVTRSMMSVPASVTVTGATGHYKVNIDCKLPVGRVDVDLAISLSGLHRMASLALYRTAASGTIYYRVNTGYWIPASFTMGSAIRWTDDTTDTDLVKNGMLYTTGNALEQCAPPSTKVFEIHQRRLWGINEENGDLFYSAEFLEGEGPWFNSEMTIETGNKNARPVALVSLGDNLVVFWTDKIGVVYGSGPNIQGQGGTYTEPQIFSNGIGTVNSRSLARTPVGIVFQDSSGYYLTDGQSVKYIGAGVKSYETYSVADASVFEDKHQVRFAVNNSLVAYILVYDYEIDQWFVWGDYQTSDGTISGLGGWLAQDRPIYSGGNVNGKHCLVNVSGNTLEQSTGGYVDYLLAPSVTYNTFNGEITTPWIKLAGLQGFQRAWRAFLLGEYISPHHVHIDIHYDYDTTTTRRDQITRVITSSLLNKYHVEFGIPKQRCEAIRFKIVLEITGAGAACATLSGLRLEYGTKGSMRLPRYVAP